jgi:hypothetical protein
MSRLAQRPNQGGVSEGPLFPYRPPTSGLRQMAGMGQSLPFNRTRFVLSSRGLRNRERPRLGTQGRGPELRPCPSRSFRDRRAAQGGWIVHAATRHFACRFPVEPDRRRACLSLEVDGTVRRAATGDRRQRRILTAVPSPVADGTAEMGPPGQSNRRRRSRMAARAARSNATAEAASANRIFSHGRHSAR